MHIPVLPITAGPPWRVGGPAMGWDGPRPPIGSLYRREYSCPLAEKQAFREDPISHRRP
jgi:hypothetical protein